MVALLGGWRAQRERTVGAELDIHEDIEYVDDIVAVEPKRRQCLGQVVLTVGVVGIVV